MMMARSNSNTPSTAMPSSRNGSEISHDDRPQQQRHDCQRPANHEQQEPQEKTDHRLSILIAMSIRAKILRIAFIYALATLPVASHAALPPAVGETPMPTLAPMIKRVSPAVVNIATRGTIRERSPQNPLLEDPFFRRFFDIPDMGPRERQFQSAGSGVIFDAKNGYIVTNAHVVDNATEITVTLQDGRDLTATVVGSDVPSDVAVLKVPPESLIQVALGDSTRLEVGRLRRRHRQSLRPAAHRHLRHRQRPRPLRHQPGRLRGLHPDRRVHQSGQLRRRAGESQGRARRHQQRHPLAQRRQHRHRLRHPGQHGAQHHGPAAQVRLREARVVRREHLLADARHGQVAQHRQHPGRAGVAGHAKVPRPRRPASSPATSSPASTARPSSPTASCAMPSASRASATSSTWR